MHVQFQDYEISDDKSRLDLETIGRLLRGSYWASERTDETIRRSVDYSRCFGVYDRNGRQVAFARVITDNATVFYLCDVIVEESCRGSGIGKALTEAIVQCEELRGITGYLATADAFGLYEKFGFRKEPNWMMRRLAGGVTD